MSTLTGDSAAAGNGGEVFNAGSLTVAGSIFAAAAGNDCDNVARSQTRGFNLGTDDSCPFTAATSNAELTG